LKYNKKKLNLYICGLILSLGFVGCSSNNEVVEPTSEVVETVAKTEPTQSEINAGIKKDAVKADFVILNGHEEDNLGKPYIVEGEVSFVGDTTAVLPTFSVTTKEGNGVGMYDITNFDKVIVAKGDKVKVYGKLTGKSDIGLIQISGNIIEK
jgi:hypothetical protein